MITSPTNNLVKLVTSLHYKKGRNEQNLYLAEGIHLVTEALKAGVKIQRFLWTDKLLSSPEGKKLLQCLEEQSTGTEVTEGIFCKIAETENPQGVLALIEIPPPQSLDFSQISLGVIIDGVQDPGNVGTIIRTAWAVGADCLFFTSGTADPYQGKVVRSTMGGIFYQRIVNHLTPQAIYTQARENGVAIVGGYPGADQSYYDINFLKPTLFLVGSEGKGISQEWAEYDIQKVHIPQPGHAESLNVAVSCGILLYEAVRQRITGKV